MLLDLIQAGEGTPVYAGHDIEIDIGRSCCHAYGCRRSVERGEMATHPVVVVPKAVEADRHGVDSGAAQTLEAFGRKGKPIRHDSPRVTPVIELTANVFKVFPEERLAPGYDYVDMVRVDMRRNAVNNLQEMLSRHVGNCR